MHVEDVVLYLELVYSRQFIDLFETQITSQIKVIRSSGAEPFDKRMWCAEARRSLRYAFFLRYYAAFESHLKVICERFAKKQFLSLRLSDISGENFLNKANKYLTRVVGCTPLDKHQLWDDILTYSWIRNAIIHNDGLVADKKNIPQYVAQRLNQGRATFTMSAGGQIGFQRRFCYQAVKLMAKFLLDIYGSKK